jgi:hypothetical protein
MTDTTSKHGHPAENDNPEPEAPPAAGRQIAFEDIIVWAQQPLTLMCKGLFASSSNLPAEAVMMALAAAMGRVMSEGSASDVPAATLAIRAKIADQFTQQLKGHVKAFRAPGIMPTMAPLKTN